MKLSSRRELRMVITATWVSPPRRDRVLLYTKLTAELVKAMVKPAIPSPSIFFRMAGSGRISEVFRRRRTRFPVRKRSTQAAESI